MTKKVGIISQARTGSSRLPGKVLKLVNGKTLLEYHLIRLRETGYPVFVATTIEPSDQAIVDLCAKLHVPCYRGSEAHVLSRYIDVIRAEKLDVVVRVTSDCPLIDPKLVRQGIDEFLKLDEERAYLSNAVERTYARGFDFEITSAAMLEEALALDTSPASTEHVTAYLYSGRAPHLKQIHSKQAVDHSFMRVTVDEVSDFKLIEELIVKYHADKKSASEIEAILDTHHELMAINREVEQKKI